MEFVLAGSLFSRDLILGIDEKSAKIRSHENFMPYGRCRVGLEKGRVLTSNRTCWFTSAAYQTRLVEPWFVFWRAVVELKYPWRDQTSLVCHRTVRLD